MSKEKIEISKKLLIDTIGLLVANDRLRKGLDTGGNYGIDDILASGDFFTYPLIDRLRKKLGKDSASVVETCAQNINDSRAKTYLVESANFLLEPYLIYDFSQLYNASKEKEKRWSKEKHLMTNEDLAEFLESDAVKGTTQTNTRKAFQYLENVKDFESRLSTFKKALKDETPTPF